MIKVVNIDDIIDYVERKTGRKVIDSSFDNNTFTAHLSGDIEPVNITATVSFNKHFENKQELVLAGNFEGKDIYVTQEVKNVIGFLQCEINDLRGRF